MNEMQVFENEQFGKVRGVTIDGAPWMVGKDVASALGYNDTDQALRKHVDPEDKVTRRFDGEPGSKGGNPNMTIINESGLYSLILSSKLPTAKQFKRWITSEVLPSIRKNGGYIAGQKDMTDVELLAKAVLVAQRTIDERNARIAALEAQAKANEAKVLFADAVTASDNTILIGELAKLLKQNGVENMGQNRLFKWLREHGYLIRRKGTDYNMPTQKAMESGLFRVKETAITHSDGHVTIGKTPKVTGTGQNFFINVFLPG